MIQLNLLPDVKMEYIKAQRTRGLVLSSAVIIALGSIALLILLLVVGGLQKKHISDLNKDIKSDTSTLQKKPEITKILTVQNQLNKLSDLHSSKPAAASLFTYLNEVTPTKANISSFTIDFSAQTIEITGTANSLSTVNQYVDTLKFTKYTAEDEKPQAAFKDVVMSSFAVNSTDDKSNQAVSYTITLSYDPILFDITQQGELVIPSTTTTRMQPDQMSDLFVSIPQAAEGGN